MKLKSKLLHFYLLLLITLHLAVYSEAGTLFCPKSDVTGFEQEHRNGNLYVGSSTQTNKGLEFYVTAKDDTLFLQSNFQPSDAHYPYKLVTDENFLDLKFLAENLMSVLGHENLPSGFDTAYSKDAYLYYDIDLLSHPRFKNLNLQKTHNVYFVNNSGEKWLLKSIENQRYLEITENISLKIPSLDVKKASFGKDLQSLVGNLESSFDKNNLKLLAIVNDLDTQEAISNKLPANNAINLKSHTIEDFRQVFKENKGSRIFLLGHFDSQKKLFVATDEFDKPIAELKFEELEKIAREYDIRLYPFGCETGKNHDTNGTLQKFNSVDAVNRMQEALNTSSWKEFFRLLGQDDLEFVVTNSFVENSETVIDLDIIKRGGNGKPPRKVGSIRISNQGLRSISQSNSSQIPVNPCLSNSNNYSTNANCNGNATMNGIRRYDAEENTKWDLSTWIFPLFILVLLIIGGTIGFIIHKIN